MSESNGFLQQVAPLLQLDPDLDAIDSLGSILGATELLEAALRILHTPPVIAAMASPTSGDTTLEGPPGTTGPFAPAGSL